MATAVADSYTVAPGQPVNAGRFGTVFSGAAALDDLGASGGILGIVFAGWAGDIVVAGDSLTAFSYPSAGYLAGLPLTMHPPRVIYNAGIPNDTTTDLLNRFDADVIAKGAQVAMVRIGTNGGNIQPDFTAMFGKLKTAGMKGIFHAIPPKGLGTANVMSPIDATNVWLKAQCEADPAWLQFIDDSRDLGDAFYNCIPSFYIDNIHMNGKGVMAQGRAMSPRLKQILVQIDPRVTDATDKYPATNQYVQNGQIDGSGALPTGWSAGAYGGNTSAATSIIAADAGDPVQVHWLRVSYLTGGGNTFAFSVSPPMLNPAITTAIKRFDIVAELRLNNLDTDKCSTLAVQIAAGANPIAGGNINLGGGGIISERMVYRDSINRDTALAYAANQLTASMTLTYVTSFTTSIGSIDIRCVSIRGLTA